MHSAFRFNFLISNFLKRCSFPNGGGGGGEGACDYANRLGFESSPGVTMEQNAKFSLF